MKRIFRKITKFFYFLFHPSEKKVESINNALEKAVQKETIERLKLKREINLFVRKRYQLRLSKYIPRKPHNPLEIHASIAMAFGDRMNDLSLTLNPDLTWKK